MNDEDLYLEATKEVEGDSKNPALWAKVMALSNGDQEKAKYQYIKLRVEQLAIERKNASPKFTKVVVNDFNLRYMPVAEFSRIKSIPESDVIKNIRDGIYIGQIKNDTWYVSRDEVKKEDRAFNASKTVGNAQKSTKNQYVPVEEFAKYKGMTSEKAIQMIRDGFYQGQIIEDHWHVAYSEIDNGQSTQAAEKSNFFSKLAGGECGLAKTYWQYWVLVGVIISVIINVIANVANSAGGAVILILLLGYMAYEVPVLLGVWRAADKYTGPMVWAVLAKIAVVLGWFGLGSCLFFLIELTNA